MTVDYSHTPVGVAGRTAVVIGGTSGIGRAIARGFAADGADVVASSRTQEWVAETAADLRELGAETIERTCDVTDRDSLEALVDETIAELGDVDVLVNSPSAIVRKRLLDVPEDEWQHVLDVQLDGVYRACQLFGRRMGTGAIINVASLSSVVSMSNLAAYSAAKGGVDSLTQVAAKEMAPDVRVNAIRPGYFVTEQNEDAYAEGTYRRRRIEERAPMGRVGDVEELVGAAIYLASDAASYTVGEILTVDGGFGRSAFE